jgi:hypothetical protein
VNRPICSAASAAASRARTPTSRAAPDARKVAPVKYAQKTGLGSQPGTSGVVNWTYTKWDRPNASRARPWRIRAARTPLSPTANPTERLSLSAASQAYRTQAPATMTAVSPVV